MKIIPAIFCFHFLIFIAASACGQGWQWAKYNTGAGVEGWLTATDKAGNIFVSGFTGQNYTPAVFGPLTISYTPGLAYEALIVKYSPAGDPLWGVDFKNGSVWPIAITTDPSGNVYFLGAFDASYEVKIGAFTLINPHYPDPYSDVQYILAKIDPSGNVLWAINDGSTYAGAGGLSPTNSIFSTGGIAVDAAGNSYISAELIDTVVTVGPYTFYNHDPTASSGDIIVAKYDPTGHLAWAESFGGSGEDDPFGMTVTPAGDVYLTGIYSSSSISFGSFTLTGTGIETGFIVRLNGAGTPVWASSTNSPETYGVALTSDDLGNVYLAGGINGGESVSFSGTTITNPYPFSVAILYLAKFDPLNNVVWYKTISSGTTTGLYCFSLAFAPCGYVWLSGAMQADVITDGR